MRLMWEIGAFLMYDSGSCGINSRRLTDPFRRAACYVDCLTKRVPLLQNRGNCFQINFGNKLNMLGTWAKI